MPTSCQNIWKIQRIWTSENEIISSKQIYPLYRLKNNLSKNSERDYDSEVGRWISKDPIRFGGGDTNLYGYVFNGPVNFVDPSGLSSENYVSELLNQEQQVKFGVILAGIGSSITAVSLLNQNAALTVIGLFLVYEGNQNVQKRVIRN